MANALNAFGTLLKRNGTTIAEVTAITPPSLARDPIEVTHHQSPNAWREKIKGLKDGGEVTFSINYLPTNTTHNAATGILGDFGTNTIDTWSIVFPDATTWTFSAFVSGFEADAPIDDRLAADVTLTVCGQPTLA
jgi:predicted secreted protein